MIAPYSNPPILASAPAHGDVVSWDADIGQWVPVAQSGGAGNVIVRHFPFAFDTPGILTGAALYTPTIGDILMDAWFEITTEWDGTSPLGDVGTFLGDADGGTHGFYGEFDIGRAQIPVLMNGGAVYAYGGLLVGIPPSLQEVSAFQQMVGPQYDFSEATGSAGTIHYTTGASPLFSQNAMVPARITTAAPIKVVVSQDGTTTGADPGSTQGAAVLYLCTCTPV